MFEFNTMHFSNYFAAYVIFFLFAAYWIYESVEKYDVFGRIYEFFTSKKEFNEEVKRINNLAQLKLYSNSPKDIEDFISSNSNYLSQDNVKLLANRFEVLATDKIINERK